MAGSIFAARPETAPVPPRQPPAKTQSVEQVMVILRNFFEQRPNSVLLGCFREQDADGSGQLELAEFTRALQSLNINLSDADIAGVFAALDSDGGGILELKEFLNELKAEPDPRQARWLRLGIGHQYVEPNREPPSTLGVKNEPWLSGFNRGNRTLAPAAPGARVRCIPRRYKSGRVRAIGVSHYCPRHIRDIWHVSTVNISMNQVEYHVGMKHSPLNVTDDPQFDRANGIYYESFMPLCGQFCFVCLKKSPDTPHPFAAVLLPAITLTYIRACSTPATPKKTRVAGSCLKMGL